MASSGGETGKIVSINISSKKSVRKKPVARALLVEEKGLEGDAHAASWHRQVSLLALESIEKMRSLGIKVNPGDFAENITTSGLNLISLPVGSLLEVGNEVLLEVTQIGKICHTKCAIYLQAGDCIMPREGIFARVLKGGKISKGDKIRILERKTEDARKD